MKNKKTLQDVSDNIEYITVVLHLLSVVSLGTLIIILIINK